MLSVVSLELCVCLFLCVFRHAFIQYLLLLSPAFLFVSGALFRSSCCFQVYFDVFVPANILALRHCSLSRRVRDNSMSMTIYLFALFSLHTLVHSNSSVPFVHQFSVFKHSCLYCMNMCLSLYPYDSYFPCSLLLHAHERASLVFPHPGFS